MFEISLIAFVMMSVAITAMVGTAIVKKENLRGTALTQTGDSSLSPQSVYWLAGIAFAGACLICLI